MLNFDLPLFHEQYGMTDYMLVANFDPQKGLVSSRDQAYATLSLDPHEWGVMLPLRHQRF